MLKYKLASWAQAHSQSLSKDMILLAFGPVVAGIVISVFMKKNKPIAHNKPTWQNSSIVSQRRQLEHESRPHKENTVGLSARSFLLLSRVSVVLIYFLELFVFSKDH